MPKPTDVMITVPVYEPQQYNVSKFLKVKPAALGILEVLIGLLGLGLTIWIGILILLWSPVIYVLFGAITVSAACTTKPCLVKFSQVLSYVNILIAAISLLSHIIFTWGVTCFILTACDILTIIFSITVAASSCSCCCKPQPRHAVINYMDTDFNHVMVMGQPDLSAMTQRVSSVMYVLPNAPGLFPPAHLPNCGPVPSAPPPNYSPTPSTPPPSYEQITAAPPLNYSPNPSAPPLTYEIPDEQDLGQK